MVFGGGDSGGQHEFFTASVRRDASWGGVTPVFPLTTGSPVLSGYYGVRRSFLSDSDFHGSKPLPGDAHSPSAVNEARRAKRAVGGATVSEAGAPRARRAGEAPPGFPLPLQAAPPPGGGQSLRLRRVRSNSPQQCQGYSRPRSGARSKAVQGRALLSAAKCQRDSWEQTLLPDAFSQPDPVPTEALQTLPPSASCLSPLESVSSTQHRSASWGASLSGTQPYSLHTLEDLHHAPGYPTPPPYPFAPFMTMSNDLLPKGLSLSPDEGTDASSLHDPSPWTKDDGSMAWGSYECRRAY
nr:uncharacterized protein C11orf53 homolog [Cavia porcellus]